MVSVVGVVTVVIWGDYVLTSSIGSLWLLWGYCGVWGHYSYCAEVVMVTIVTKITEVVMVNKSRLYVLYSDSRGE